MAKGTLHVKNFNALDRPNANFFIKFLNGHRINVNLAIVEHSRLLKE